MINAINTANSNNEDNTIVLATGGVYTFIAPYSGGDGLPLIVHNSDHTLMIEGSGAVMAYSGSSDLRFFHNISVTVISNLTMSGGNASSSTNGGGAVYNGGPGTLTLNNCVLSSNSVLDSSFVTDPEQGGGAISNRGNLTVQNCLFSNNTACNRGESELRHGTALNNFQRR